MGWSRIVVVHAARVLEHTVVIIINTARNSCLVYAVSRLLYIMRNGIVSWLLGIIHLIIIGIVRGLLSKEVCAVVILITWWQASACGFLAVLEFRELLVIPVLIVIRISLLTSILHLPIGGGLFPCRIVTTLILLVYVALHLKLTMV